MFLRCENEASKRKRFHSISNGKAIVYLINKHNQRLISILENQKIYEGFLKILIFRVSLSRTNLQSKKKMFHVT